MEKSSTDLIYEEKFNAPVVELSEYQKKEFESFLELADIDYVDEHDWESVIYLIDCVDCENHLADKEITIDDIKAVIKDNVKIIREVRKRNGNTLENFKKRTCSVTKPFPHKEKDENWQFNLFNRYFFDFEHGTTHWRKADAIATSYARQLFEKVGDDGIKKMFAKLDLQLDKIEEQLEITCNLKNKIVETDEQLPARISLFNKLAAVQDSLENMLFANYEQFYLLGKAQEHGYWLEELAKGRDIISRVHDK